MTLAKRLVAPTAEGKKHDDPIETTRRMGDGASAMWMLRGPRKKRILLSLLAFVAVYFFVKYLPTDVPPVSLRRDSHSFLGRGGTSDTPLYPTDGEAPPRPQGAMKERYFDGPVKFYYLTSSLYKGIMPKDNARNILFGISNIKSASNVLPMACEMSNRNRNRVHVVLFGRHDISVEALKDIYGISDADCPVSWHDGRPDYAAYSSDERMATSVRAALHHILYYMKPHVIVVDEAAREDNFFPDAVQSACAQAGVPIITLPDPALERMGWLCELDGASLGYWTHVQVEILVHGAPVSSASLIRLLKSIASADYTGATYPRLTIELPDMMDAPTLGFLSRFQWPPGSSEADSKLTLRRHLSSKALGPLESSLRTVESFYPAHADKSHVLVLTPDVEVSTMYYGYLKYLLLEYRYSSSAIASLSAFQLMGISLECPSALHNGTRLDLAGIAQINSPPLFLWQGPNSRAALYFGEKWVEFHSFLSRRLATTPEPSSSVVAGSNEHPAWLPYMSELIRARNYHMLYPEIKPGGLPLVTIHDDLYHSTDDLPPANVVTGSTLPPLETAREAVLTDAMERERSAQPRTVVRNTESISSILLGIPGNSTLPQLQSLPHIAYEGVLVSPETLYASSVAFADHFSLGLGGCKSLNDRTLTSAGTADDLFCETEDKFG
jgi:hypothetical protein